MESLRCVDIVMAAHVVVGLATRSGASIHIVHERTHKHTHTFGQTPLLLGTHLGLGRLPPAGLCEYSASLVLYMHSVSGGINSVCRRGRRSFRYPRSVSYCVRAPSLERHSQSRPTRVCVCIRRAHLGTNTHKPSVHLRIHYAHTLLVSDSSRHHTSGGKDGQNTSQYGFSAANRIALSCALNETAGQTQFARLPTTLHRLMMVYTFLCAVNE